MAGARTDRKDARRLSDAMEGQRQGDAGKKNERTAAPRHRTGGERVALELVRHSNHREIKEVRAEFGTIAGMRGNFKPSMQMRTSRDMNAAGVGVQQREHQENDEVDPHP